MVATLSSSPVSGSFKAACIQVNAGADMAENLARVVASVEAAAEAGARFIVTPENVVFMARSPDRLRAVACLESAHPAVAGFSALAQRTRTWLLAGSLAIRCPGSGLSASQEEAPQAVNRSFLFDPQGGIAARYDKIHLFDVDLGGGEKYHESAIYRPGERAVVADTPWGGIGLSICYDLRFAHLYRALAQAGAFLFTIPAAFTRPTGRAHWRSLLRARAIECGCYVLAPAQCGIHDGARETYGHSMIIDPWGEILAEAGDETGAIMSVIEPRRSAESREKLPALAHDRPFAAPSANRSSL